MNKNLATTSSSVLSQDSSKNVKHPTCKSNLLYAGTVSWDELPCNKVGYGSGKQDAFAVVTPNGTMILRINKYISIEMSIDGATLILNYKYNTHIGIDGNIKEVGFTTEKYNLFANPVKVHVDITEKRDRITDHTFVSFNHSSVALYSPTIDIGTSIEKDGFRASVTSYTSVEDSIANVVFKSNSKVGKKYISRCLDILQNVLHYSTGENNYWFVHGFTISENVRTGLTWILKDKIMPNGEKKTAYGVKTCTQDPGAFVTFLENSMDLQISASNGCNEHLFVKRQQQEVCCNRKHVIINFNGYSAGYECSDDGVRIF